MSFLELICIRSVFAISYLHESCSFLSDAHNVSTQQVLIEMFVMMHFIFKTLFEMFLTVCLVRLLA